jgi:hypothetical protein
MQELRSTHADMNDQLVKLSNEQARLSKSLVSAREMAESHKTEAERHAQTLEELKVKHETDMAQARKNTAGLQRDKSDLLSELNVVRQRRVSGVKGRMSRGASPLVHSTQAEEDEADEEDVFGGPGHSPKKRPGFDANDHAHSPSQLYQSDFDSPEPTPSKYGERLRAPLGDMFIHEIDQLRASLDKANQEIEQLKSEASKDKPEADEFGVAASPDSEWATDFGSTRGRGSRGRRGRGRGVVATIGRKLGFKRTPSGLGTPGDKSFDSASSGTPDLLRSRGITPDSPGSPMDSNESLVGGPTALADELEGQAQYSDMSTMTEEVKPPALNLSTTTLAPPPHAAELSTPKRSVFGESTKHNISPSTQGDRTPTKTFIGLPTNLNHAMSRSHSNDGTTTDGETDFEDARETVGTLTPSRSISELPTDTEAYETGQEWHTSSPAAESSADENSDDERNHTIRRTPMGLGLAAGGVAGWAAAQHARASRESLRTIEKIVEVPVDRIVEVEKIVEVPVDRIVEVPVDRIVEVEKIVEKIVEVPVDRIVEVEKLVDRVVEVPVDRIVEVEKIVDRIVEVPVDRIVEVEKLVDRIVEVPVEKIVEVEKIVDRIVEVPVEKIVEVPVDRIVEVEKIVEKIVEKTIEVPVDRIVEVPVEKIVEVEKIVQVGKIVEVPVEKIVEVEKIIEKIVEVPVDRIVEVPVDRIVEVEKIVEVPKEVIVEKIVEVPVDRIVEKIVEVPKEVIVERIVEKPVDRIVEVEKIVTKEIQVPTEVERIVEKIVEVPVHVEKPVDRVVEVEKIVEVPVQVFVDREVPVDRIVEVEKRVEVPVEVIREVEKIVEVPVEVIREVEKRVEVPVEVIREVEKRVEVPVEVIKEVEKRVEVPVEVIKEVEVERIVERIVEVPVEVIKEVEKIVEKIVEVPVEKIVHVEVEKVVEKIVEVPVDRIVEQRVEVPVDRVVEKIVEVEKVVEKIVEVPVDRVVEKIVEVEKVVEKIVEVPVERVVEKIVEVPVDRVVEKIVEVPVDRIVQVPVDRIVEKIVEVPVERVVTTTIEVPAPRAIHTDFAIQTDPIASIPSSPSARSADMALFRIAPGASYDFLKAPPPAGSLGSRNNRLSGDTFGGAVDGLPATRALSPISIDGLPTSPMSDRSKTPTLNLPPPPSMPPPTGSIKKMSTGAPPRPTSPPPDELLNRAPSAFRQSGQKSAPSTIRKMGPPTTATRQASSSSFQPTSSSTPVRGEAWAKSRDSVRRRAHQVITSDTRSITSSFAESHRNPSLSSMESSSQPRLAGQADNSREPVTDPTAIHAITQTMIGEYLYKYTRNKLGKGQSDNRHKRFFWVHPYTKTLYWSGEDPGSTSASESSSKSGMSMTSFSG